MLDEGTPLFVQIAAQVADDIADGSLAEGGRAPSTNELAAFHRINPATAAKRYPGVRIACAAASSGPSRSAGRWATAAT